MSAWSRIVAAVRNPQMEEPERPSAPALLKDLPELVPDRTEPVFETVPGVVHKFRGARPKGLEGAIVHYDAGRARPGKSPGDQEIGARQCLSGAVTNGFAFAAISRSGRVLLPANMDWNQWGYHAGQSLCPVTRRSGVSQYYVGFEINSPGYVFPTGDPDLFVPWFEAVRDPSGNPVLNKGKAQVKNPGGELYRAAEVRTFWTKTGNIRPGTYVPYTKAQMDALVNVLLWLKKRYPASFRLDLVFGHDEVAPTRKLDPGGCLGAPGAPGLTMAEFRTALQKAWEKRNG